VINCIYSIRDPKEPEIIFLTMASHSYLGDIQAIRSRSFLNECYEYEIIILPLPNIVLFPGETVPLRIRNQSYIEAIEKLMNKQENTFHGGLTSLHLGVVNQDKEIIVGSIGTTSEIRYSNSSTVFRTPVDPDSTAVDEVVLTAKGCHRFRVLEKPRKDRGVYFAKVVILEEKIPVFGWDAGAM
jgi:Lon protease-like protein